MVTKLLYNSFRRLENLKFQYSILFWSISFHTALTFIYFSASAYSYKVSLRETQHPSYNEDQTRTLQIKRIPINKSCRSNPDVNCILLLLFATGRDHVSASAHPADDTWVKMDQRWNDIDGVKLKKNSETNLFPPQCHSALQKSKPSR